jgi:hypothetical protein
VVVVVLVAAGGGADLGYMAIRSGAASLQATLTRDLQIGQQELESGKTSLSQANAKHDASLVPQATQHFTAARAEFLGATQMADSSGLLYIAEHMPSVGDSVRQKHAALSEISAMGVALSDAGLDLSVLAGQLIQPSSSGASGRTLLTVLNETQPSLTKVRGDLDRAQKAAAKVDVKIVPSGQLAAFLKARTTIDAAITGLDEFERLDPILVDVLGGNGPRNFLLEQVNAAELRAGGGFIGTYSLIHADQGTLTVVRSGDGLDLDPNPYPKPGQPGFIVQPNAGREANPGSSWDFVDSNIFPDFPSNAKAAEMFVDPRLGLNVDAVISIDYYTVAQMLDLTGPLTVPGVGTLTGSNFIATLIPLDISNASHKAIIAAIAGQLMQRVTALPSDQWPALIGALNTLASQRHLQAYFNNPSTEAEMERIGWSGSLKNALDTEFMMEVEGNYGGNKVNYYLTRQYTVELTRNGNTLHHVITVDFVNREVCGTYPRTMYIAAAELFVSAAASPVSTDLRPLKYGNPPPPSGTRAGDGWVPIVYCSGGRGRVVFTYDTPWTAPLSGSYQIYWQKQPGTVNDGIAVTWNDGAGHTFKVNGDLSQDRLIELSTSAVTLATGQPGQATLPSLSLG